LTPFVALQQGDTYNTYCSYDTSLDNVSVTYGETTSNEMCFNFIAYYPLLGTFPTYGCTFDEYASTSPGATSCSLLPGDPPAAYVVTGWTVADVLFKTGGTATCATGFRGTAVISCAGSGAPFTFSGCVRVATPPSVGSAVHMSGSFALLFFLALLW